MKLQDPVSSVMSQRVMTLHPKNKIKEAQDIFDKYPIHHLPIVVMKKVVGIISMGDILFLTKKPIMHSFDKWLRNQKLSIDAVEEIMTKHVITMDKDKTINEAIGHMVKHRINAIPIVENEELVGLVTSYDILRNLKED